MEQRSVAAALPELAADQLGFFRWGHVGDRIVVTNDAGDWALLSDAEFADLLAGRVAAGHARFDELQRKGFLRDGLDLDALAARVAQRNRHVRRGAHLHVLILTLRGGTSGADARAEGAELDMSTETAEQIVELALQSTSPVVAFELQGEGGEALLNFATLRHLVEFARSRNKQAAGKTLSFRVLSNLTAMTEEIAEWLIANDVLLTTTLDGPAAVHDWNRTFKGGSAHADVVRWIEYFHRRYAELGRDPQFRVEALVGATRKTLEAWRDVVDEYIARGLRTIHLRPLDAWRFEPDVWAKIGYTAKQYLDFYRHVLEYILQINQRGTDLAERTATVVLSKMLSADDPAVVDIQSPSGSGTSQLAYNVDGRVFPSDEAQRIDALGDPIFDLGHVRHLSLVGIVRHPTVRAIAAASLLDAQPMCAECWNKPFCGFDPVRNYRSQGDLFGQRPHCFECKEHMAISSRLIEVLAEQGEAAMVKLLERWKPAVAGPAIGARVVKGIP